MVPRVETIGLRKTYRVGRLEVPVLRGVDLTLMPGEFVAVMGPSGCGKSTLLYLIGGLTPPSAGRLLIDGIDLAALPERRRVRLRREKVGFVFQRFNLLPTLSALGNLRLAMRIRRGRDEEEEAVDLLRRVGLDGKACFRPGALSAGEQQRVAIARALVNRPALLLADEPTGNLDSAASAAVLDLIEELNREFGQTILLVTHDREVAARAQRVIHLRDGRVLPSGGEEA